MVKLVTVKCLQCNHVWKPREENPKRCRKCGSYHWNKPASSVRLKKMKVGVK